MIRMLLCDDDEIILEGICEYIDWQSYGIELIGAVNNGKKAMQILERENPDLIVTDIKMPYYTGLDIARAAKEKNEDTIVVILSGYNDFEYARKAIKMGVLDFISKPIDLDELDHVLRKVTAQWENQQHSRSRDMRDGFARLINRTDDALPDELAWMSEIFENRIVCVSILELDEFQLVMYGGSEEIKYETIKDYKELADRFEKQGIIAMERSEYSMFLCCYRESESDMELQLGILRQNVRLFNESEHHITKVTLACSKFSDDFGRMNRLKNQAEDALRFKFIKGIGQTIRYGDIEEYVCGPRQAVVGELALPSPMKLGGREE
ncbi:MAG: response regulator, partial [Lachnospiraceae bacterium]|nr:response regulator [Lachnospiraceae bacterium]